jgi:hypothetical protein
MSIEDIKFNHLRMSYRKKIDMSIKYRDNFVTFLKISP